MTPERWQQISVVYQSALDKPPAARAAFVAETCRDDSDLRREVESLLARESAHVMVDDPVDVTAAALIGSAPGLTAGSFIGSYRVTALIGEGGMGQVYRAHDTKLQRDVALKILPESFIHDPDRLARFTREAHVLASLNHPNIGAIYGFEDSGAVHALVLELVEGPTLADRLARGPIPVDEALAIARQIAEALEAAHEHGIVHRDLKPANIKVRDDGTVKVLDFGLAKPRTGTVEADPRVRLTQSPTIMSPAVTAAGIILGTAAYMSPEQAKGKPADKRSDIWAFGCVLYEMLTGKRAFDGDDVSDTLAAVLRGVPDFDALPTDLPPTVRVLIERCLAKDHRHRIADISTAIFVISEPVLLSPSTAGTTTPSATTPAPSGWEHRALVIAGIVIAAASSGLGVWLTMRPEPPRVTRLAIPTSGATQLSTSLNNGHHVAIARDASRIVFVGGPGDPRPDPRLFIRGLDQLDSAHLADGVQPFFSPDGLSVGYFDPLVSTGRYPRLLRVPATGGAPIVLAAVDGAVRGGTWGEDDSIIYASNNTQTGLHRIAASGGESTILTRPDFKKGELGHYWPSFLPGAQAVLFTIERAGDTRDVAVLDLRTNSQKVLIRGGSDAAYAPSGHLVYQEAGELRAVPFDLKRLEVLGAAVPVLSQVSVTAGNTADYGFTTNGTLVYATSQPQSGPLRTIVWVDRLGHEAAIAAPVRAYTYPRISPEGGRVAFDIRDQDNDIWVWDFARQTLARLTTDQGLDRIPAWTPDGTRILFSSNRAGTPSVFWQRADGTGQVERLTAGPRNTFPVSVSPDGAHLVLWEGVAGPPTTDLMMVDLPRSPSSVTASSSTHTLDIRPLIQTNFGELNGEVSPDGRWIAYESNESGGFEIYVRPFPNVDGGRWLISNGGGAQPLWSRKGDELFYLSPMGGLMSVRIGGGPSWSAAPPARVFDAREYFLGGANSPLRTYDVSTDGRRFLMIKPVNASPQASTTADIIVVQNWFQELKRLAPRK